MKAIFIPIRQQLDKNQEQYDNICSRNKANIESRYKSGIPNSTKSTSGKSGIPNSTKKPEEQEQEQEYNKLNKFNLLEKSEILKIFESEKLNLVFMNFIENRKQQHKPITKLALEQNIKKINSWLEKYPVEAVI
jgi:hypothetical protein